MTTRCRRPSKPTAASAIVLILVFLFGQQIPTQAGLLDALVSTTTQLLSPLLGWTTGLLSKVSGDLQALLGGPADQQVAVIVQTYNPPDSSELNLLQVLGGLLKTTYTGIPGYSATVPLGSLAQIANDSNV